MKPPTAATLALARELERSRGPGLSRRLLLGALAARLGGPERAAAAGLPPPGPADAPLTAWAHRVADWAAATGQPDPLGWCLQLLGGAGRKVSGAFYTPEPVAAYLCRQALAGLEPRAGPPAGGLRVLDPACGSGTFLQAARAIAPPAVVLEGWDRDPDAVAVARFNLAGSPATFTCCDALSREETGCYDAVVGNPPYRGSGLRGLASWAPEQRAEWSRRFHAAEYKLNLYPLFIELGIRLLRPAGRLAYILPDSFLLGRYFARLRRLLLDGCRVLEVCLLDGNLWPEATVGRSVLLVLERQDPGPRHSARVRRVHSPAELTPAAPAYHQPQAEWQAQPRGRMRLFFDPEEAALVRQLEQHPRVRPLGDWLQTYSGLIARAGQQSLFRSTHPGGRVDIARQGRLLYSGTPPPEAWRPLLVSGREVDRYRVQWRGEYGLMEPTLIKSGARQELYRQPKLFLRQTADELRAAYDASGLFCLNNLHLLVRRDPADPHHLLYWLALLNSRLLSRYYRLITREEGRTHPQVDLELLATLPFRGIDWQNPAEQAAHHRLVHRVRQRMAAADSAQAAALDQQIEAEVCRLYGEVPE